MRIPYDCSITYSIYVVSTTSLTNFYDKSLNSISYLIRFHVSLFNSRSRLYSFALQVHNICQHRFCPVKRLRLTWNVHPQYLHSYRLTSTTDMESSSAMAVSTSAPFLYIGLIQSLCVPRGIPSLRLILISQTRYSLSNYIPKSIFIAVILRYIFRQPYFVHSQSCILQSTHRMALRPW